MRKNIGTQALKARIGEIVDEVRLRGDRYVIERRGKPVAAIVPLHVNEAFESNRQRLFSLIETIHERNRSVPVRRIEAAIAQSIEEVRRERRKRSRSK